MSNKLLPCPFCGGEVVWCGENVDGVEGIHYCDQITCNQCEYNFDVHSDAVYSTECDKEVKAHVAKLWNTRKDNDSIKAEGVIQFRNQLINTVIQELKPDLLKISSVIIKDMGLKEYADKLEGK